jgi:hypothetical protein
MRWVRLVDEAIDMFLAHCRSVEATHSPRPRSGQTTGAKR